MSEWITNVSFDHQYDLKKKLLSKSVIILMNKKQVSEKPLLTLAHTLTYEYRYKILFLCHPKNPQGDIRRICIHTTQTRVRTMFFENYRQQRKPSLH